MAARPVERKIHFYRAHLGHDDNAEPIALDVGPVLNHLHALPWTADGRYQFDAEDNALCCWIDRRTAPQRMRFGMSRRSGLPLLEEDGTVGPLGIPPDSGLLEQIHIVFFGGNIVGSDFNFYGPRLPRLRWYLSEKAADVCPPISFEPLLRHDVANHLRRFRQIRYLSLRVRSSYAETIRDLNEDIGTACSALGFLDKWAA